MNARHIISFLLILAISLATAVQPTGARAGSLRAAIEEELRLTAEEELEARELAARFMERFQATHDLGPIIDEMFVKDFTARLRQSPSGWLPWAFLDKSLVATASPVELRRYYVASMNFYVLYGEISATAAKLRKQLEDDEDELAFYDVMTPEIINVLLSDPVIAELFKDMNKDEEDGTAKEEDGNQPSQGGDSTPSANPTTEARDDSAPKKNEMGIIKTSHQLSGVSTTLEKTNELMRRRLASLPLVAPSSDDTESQKYSPPFDPAILDEGEYGYPQGTQAIHVNLLPFSIHIIREQGQLKLLSVSIYVD
ncbi:MAG: hypothetical protein ICV68_03175 [Pyrinomonadaceae bacterium]|nr:hypothetical protein [Pyrinomonadaceae bacterium]